MAEIPLKKRSGAVRGWQIYALFLIFLLGIPGSLYWAIHSPDGIPSQEDNVTVQTDQIQRVVQNLDFGLYPLSLEPGKSSPRFCLPDWSETSFKRANKETMGYIYHFNPPGDLSKVHQVKLLPGAPDIAFPESKCGHIEALTLLILTIEVKPDKTQS